MKRSYRSVAVVVLAVVSIAKGEPAASQPARRKLDPELLAIMLEYRKAQDAWMGEFDKLADESGGMHASPPAPPSGIHVPRLKEYIGRHAGTQDALDAFHVILGFAGQVQFIGCQDQPDRGVDWAVQTLTTDYARLPGVKDLLSYAEDGRVVNSRESRIRFAKAVIGVNPDREAVAEAKYALAENLLKEDPRAKPPYVPSTADHFEGQRLLRELATSYSDTTAGDRAGLELNELDHLQVGMRAPDFSATSVDGQEISMAGLRGRVVVLVFWGIGSDRDGSRIPVKPELIEKFRDRPVTFLGVSYDSAEGTRATLQKEHATFANIADGREKRIIRLWNVNRWSTIHVIDAQGVIRKRDVQAERLEKTVDELLKMVP